MSRGTWNAIKLSKRFYVRTYRWAGNGLIFSLMINVCLLFIICYVYFNQPEIAFYASSGWEPPVELTPLNHPNESSVPLLGNEPVGESTTKVIPK